MKKLSFLGFSSSHDKREICEGFKLYGHDSAYSSIDVEHQEIFALSLERVTRVKHDWGSILQIFNFESIKNIPFLHHSFSVFSFPAGSSFFDFLYSERVRKIKSIFSGNFFFQIKFFKRIFYFFYSPIFVIRIVIERIFHLSEHKFGRKIIVHKHHLCHAVSAYYLSPFFSERTLVFVLDGAGEDNFSSIWEFHGGMYRILSESKVTYHFSYEKPLNFTSIGWIYSIFTEVLGFKMISDEGKTEALAAYGTPDMELYDLCTDSYKIDEKELVWTADLKYASKLHDVEYLKQVMNKIGRENFASTIQKFLESTVTDFLNCVYRKYPVDNICLSGGVVANVIMNLNIFEKVPFKNIYISPCFGDDGSALGAAILSAIEKKLDISWLHTKKMPYWGPSYSREQVLTVLENFSHKVIWEDRNITWPEDAAYAISSGQIIAVFQGKMEFGPRALGNRSILADPRDPEVRTKMNLSIKRRPYFQPFCPSILESERERLFVDSYPNKHMTMAFRLKQDIQKVLPSACHIDGTARPQFVEEEDNPNYFRILSEIKKITGYGVVINTSFNLHGRAMVMTPEQALEDFLDCNLDALFIEGYKVTRNF